MNVRVRFVTFLCASVLLTAQAEVTVKDGAYHDLVVSFSPNVKAENGRTILYFLESLFNETSAVLQRAIGLRIASVTFHLPSTWDTSAWQELTIEPASVLATEQRKLVVDDTQESAFGTLPTTLQYGACGVPGHRLTIPVGFLNGTEEYVPRGQILAREWLKLRYGVFDENGFDGDDMYPLYYNIPGTTEARITECTDPEVEYEFRDTDGNNCSLEIPFASSTKCEIHPKESSRNTTSSLMYYHQELTNMYSVCGEEHSHKDFTPSKQNILCSGRSTWDILKMSGDFNSETKSEESQSENEEIKFSYRQEAKPRVVLAFEQSANLHEEGPLVLFATRRFLHSLPDGSEFALYSFNEKTNVIMPLSELEAKREPIIPEDFVWDKGVCSECALDTIAELLLTKPKPLHQTSVILITGSKSPTIKKELIDKYKDLDVCLKIIAFSSGESVVDYEELVSLSSCNSITTIYKKIPDDMEDLFDYQVFKLEQLYQGLQESVTQAPTDTQVKVVATGQISLNKSIDITISPSAATYTLWTARFLDLDAISCQKTDDSSIELIKGATTGGIASFTFDPVDERYVKCQLNFQRSDPVFIQVEETSKPGEYLDTEVWVHDPSNSEEQMPVIIYAKVYYGGYPVQDANLTALVIGLKERAPRGKPLRRLQLFDNGRGNPDITQGDGIYSRYFVDLEEDQKYIVTVMETRLSLEKPHIGKKGQDPCCGSKLQSTPEEGYFSIPTFKTSFHAKQKPEKGYKPSKVLDLRVANYDPLNYIVLNWTAPGGEADQGNASSYVFRYSTSRDDLKTEFNKGILLENAIEPKLYGSEETFEIQLNVFERSTTYYMAMKSSNALEQESDYSNFLEFFVPESDATKGDDGTTTDPSIAKQSGADKKTIGIIIGVLVLVIVVVVAVILFVHFVVKKPKRKKEAANKANESGNRNTTSPPISLNSIPADVILKHHNEVVNAKSQHKDPPIFKEQDLESIDLASENGGGNTSSQRNNVEYSTVQKRQPELENQRENPYPPKRMTNV